MVMQEAVVSILHHFLQKAAAVGILRNQRMGAVEVEVKSPSLVREAVGCILSISFNYFPYPELVASYSRNLLYIVARE